jgi:glyoxylase-like metal-dependent hydrolase (beta-lactamase superfamily II)
MAHDEWTENVFRFYSHGKEEITTSYIIDCGDSLVAIDSGKDERIGREMVRVANDLGKEISQIIFTHTHPEMLGGLGHLRKIYPNLQIFVHENSRPIFREGKKYVLSKQFPLGTAGGKLTVVWKTPLFENYNNLPKIITGSKSGDDSDQHEENIPKNLNFIKGGEDFQFGDETFILQHSGGHSSDSIIIHTYNTKVTFIGDELGIYNNNEYSFFFDLTGSPGRRVKALRACQRLKTKYILSSNISPIENEYIDEEVESAIQAQEHFETTLRETLLGYDWARIDTIIEHVYSTLNVKWHTPYAEFKVAYSTIQNYLDSWVKDETVLFNEKTKKYTFNREKLEADFDPYSTY